MEERLRLAKPHLERKMVYERSLHVEYAVRLQVQAEAREVSTVRLDLTARPSVPLICFDDARVC